MTAFAQDLIPILQLIRSKNVGPVTFYKLIQQHQTPAAALEALSELKGAAAIYPLAKAEAEIQAHKALNAQLITYLDPLYPALFKTMSDAPPVLSIRGNQGLLHNDMLAIVGARNASISGGQLTYGLAHQLSDHGWTIVSGFARGIDIAAHKGAMAKGSIAVFAGGIDVIYPPEHEKLYNTFLEDGLIISDMPLGTQPTKSHFPRRNRLIAGIARGTIVIEAAFQSGSLITAGIAADLGRDVFACPGSPMDPRCRGSNKLLKDGAYFVENFADVLDVYAAGLHQDVQENTPDSGENLLKNQGDAGTDAILLALSATPVSIDLLISSIDLEAQKVFELLRELELKEKIIRSGNQISLRLSA